MAFHVGTEGVIRVGPTNAMLETEAWTADLSIGVAEARATGEAWKRKKGTLKDATGTVTVNWDPDDATGQELLFAGAEVDLRLYFENTAVGAKYLSSENQTPATVLITDEGVALEVEGVTKRTFGWTGPMAWETV